MTAFSEAMFLYRAVGAAEFYAIMQTGRFSCLPGGVGLKYFGKDLGDTLRFADKVINKNIVAVLEVEVLKLVVDKIGEFISVDPFIFKHGTVEIWEANLEDFNNAIEQNRCAMAGGNSTNLVVVIARRIRF